MAFSWSEFYAFANRIRKEALDEAFKAMEEMPDGLNKLGYAYSIRNLMNKEGDK